MTSWFPPNVKPVHIGVYPVRFWTITDVEGYAHWDGQWWGCLYDTVAAAEAHRFRTGVGASQDKWWRGFTEEQK